MVFAALHCILGNEQKSEIEKRTQLALHCIAFVLANTHIDIDIVKETEATFPRHQDLHGVTQPSVECLMTSPVNVNVNQSQLNRQYTSPLLCSLPSLLQSQSKRRKQHLGERIPW